MRAFLSFVVAFLMIPPMVADLSAQPDSAVLLLSQRLMRLHRDAVQGFTHCKGGHYYTTYEGLGVFSAHPTPFNGGGQYILKDSAANLFYHGRWGRTSIATYLELNAGFASWARQSPDSTALVVRTGSRDSKGRKRYEVTLDGQLIAVYDTNVQSGESVLVIGPLHKAIVPKFRYKRPRV